ncbi:MAG: SdpI family protein [Candidatus Corynebacterium faecigallinarum]
MGDNLAAVAFPAIMAVVVAVVVSSVTKAAGRGDLPRDGSVGIRTKATKLSDAAWTAGHRAAVPRARTVSLLTSAVALVIIVLGMVVDATWVMAVGIVPFGVVIIGIIPVVQTANAAAREAHAAEQARPAKKKQKKQQKKRR